jgi:hypothetical protein
LRAGAFAPELARSPSISSAYPIPTRQACRSGDDPPCLLSSTAIKT